MAIGPSFFLCNDAQFNFFFLSLSLRTNISIIAAAWWGVGSGVCPPEYRNMLLRREHCYIAQDIHITAVTVAQLPIKQVVHDGVIKVAFEPFVCTWYF